MRGGRSRTIQDQEHVRQRQRLLSLEYKASKSRIQLYELKKNRENATTCLQLRYAFPLPNQLGPLPEELPNVRHLCTIPTIPLEARPKPRCVPIYGTRQIAILVRQEQKSMAYRMVCYPLWPFGLRPASTTRLARIGVGCDGTNALVVFVSPD